MDRFIVATALAGFALLGGLIWLETAPFMVALFVIGTVLGMALYHGAFGFTAGWRNLVVKKRGAGMRAQLMLFGLSSVIMVPMLYSGQAGLVGAVAPVGTSLVVGSFIFGLGMQLGGGCGSGTLFTVGAGNIRMVVTLVFFIAGTVLGSIHLPGGLISQALTRCHWSILLGSVVQLLFSLWG
nr:YeeE/YedE thiosulfate transporter family protein [Marinobacter sp. AC-23]